MKILRWAVALTAACLTLWAPHAGAAGSTTLYLSQLGNGCASEQWALVIDSTDTVECHAVPRVLYEGTGVDLVQADKSFSSHDKDTFRLNARRPLTGVLAITAPAPFRDGRDGGYHDLGAEAVGFASAVFTIRADDVTIGTVAVEGIITPTEPATEPVNLSIPQSLHNVRTSKITVDVAWTTCLGVVGCVVRTGGGDSHSRLVFPTR